MRYNCEYPLSFECSHSHSQRSITNKFPLAFTTLEWSLCVASRPIAAYRCQVQRINQTNWERTADDDDEWGMRTTNWAKLSEYLKDTHDCKQLQCAARIIIYMRCDWECVQVYVCVCVRVVQFKVSLDNVNIIIQLESRSESRRNAGHDDHFHRTVPDFDNDW